MSKIAQALSEKLYELVSLKNNCVVDDDAFLDGKSYRDLHQWYEQTRKTLIELDVKKTFIAKFDLSMTMGEDDYNSYEIFKESVDNFKTCLEIIIKHDENAEMEYRPKTKLGKMYAVIGGPAAPPANEEEKHKVDSVEKTKPNIINYPDKITLKWLFENVPLRFWAYLIGLFLSAFELGAFISRDFEFSFLKFLIDHLL